MATIFYSGLKKIKSEKGAKKSDDVEESDSDSDLDDGMHSSNFTNRVSKLLS